MILKEKMDQPESKVAELSAHQIEIILQGLFVGHKVIVATDCLVNLQKWLIGCECVRWVHLKLHTHHHLPTNVDNSICTNLNPKRFTCGGRGEVQGGPVTAR